MRQTKIKVNKLKVNPLFVNFLNWEGDKYLLEKLIWGLHDNFKRREDKNIALYLLNNLDVVKLDNLTSFQKIFRNKVIEMIQGNCGITEDLLVWFNNAFKYVKDTALLENKDEDHNLEIIDSEGPWLEGSIIYSFVMTCKFFSWNIIKNCPVCSNFFSHKGRYSKYCSDGCKAKGMKKS